MSALTILGAVEPLVFRPTVEREVVTTRDYSIAAAGEIERTVPPVVPSFDEPCPEPGCWEGSATVQTAPDDYDIVGVCSTCNGSGVVQRVWAAERQWRGWDADEAHYTRWWPQPMDEFCSEVAERLAVVAWHPVTVLPVVEDADDLCDSPALIEVLPNGDVYRWPEGADEEEDRIPVREPWAADLTPGCVVVIPGDEVRLAEPITEMRTYTDEHDEWQGGAHPCCKCRDCGGMVVPLALKDGLNVVELAR